MKKFNFNIDQLDIDNEGDFSLSKQQYKNKSMKQEYLMVSTFVDLGLPSGTLWAKYNLGVDPEHLNNAKDWYGNYYAWGETKPKDEYTAENYKYSTLYTGNIGYLQNSYIYTKYNSSDGKTVLDIADDAAYQENKNMCTPSENQAQELISYTRKSVIHNYLGIKDLNVCVLKSIMNDNELIIPLAGRIYNSNLEFVGRNADCMISYFCDHFNWLGYDLEISTYEIGQNTGKIHTEAKARVDSMSRCVGRTIRPVMKQ